ASTIWTPTLNTTSSDVDVNITGLHALQSQKSREQATPTIGKLSPMLKSDLLTLFLAIYHDKELAEVKEETSPTSSWSHLRPRTRREDFSGGSWDCPRRASPSFKIRVEYFLEATMASRGRRGGAPTHEDEPRRDERAEQQAPAPHGLVLPPPPPVDYRVFMQGLVQAMQTQAHTQAALQAQLEAQERADVWWASLLRTRFEDGAIDVAWDEFVRLFRAKFVAEHVHDRIE
ncbi:hypothetical protein Taro_033370, partial [Colocasia esculenta]|nr:hypothetical protein [Colocasia esculenta]